MEQNSNYITIEMSCKMRDYRIVLGVRRMWIIAITVGAIQLSMWFIKSHFN